jgi:F-type H+-transporting ATPase subunit b
MAESTAHTEQPAGHGAFPPFQSEHFPSQLLWLAVSFVLLYALMSKIALPRIGAILAERSKRISDDLAAAERLKEQSRDKQAAEAEATQKQLEAKLHERLAAAEQSIASTRNAAMGNVRSIATETAAAIVERLIGKAPADHEVAAALDATKR